MEENQDKSTATESADSNKKEGKGKASRKSKTKGKAKPKSKAKRKAGEDRLSKQYPSHAFEDVIGFAQAVYDLGAGKPVRRLTLFHQLGKSPDSGASRQLVTNSGKYGLTRGGYQADNIELTAEGLKVVGEAASEFERLEAKIKLAIEDIAPFNLLYSNYVGNKLPARSVMLDTLLSEKIPRASAEQLVDLFVVNAKYVSLIQELSGAERLIKKEHALENVAKSSPSRVSAPTAVAVEDYGTGKVNFNNICFYITPIGEEGSIERKHSDLFLNSIIEPAVETFGLQVIRADKIDKPGMITKQIIEYILNAKLVIADLSFNNPNVFYELSLRHACRLPTVQVIQKGDRIPFDVGQARTITIDCTDIYTLVPKLELYRSEISNQVRQALNDGNAVDNPLSTVYPNIKLSI